MELQSDIPLTPVSRDQELPMSTGQARLWYLNQVQEPKYTYNEQLELRIDGALDVQRLARCFNEIVKRHEALRTVFVQTKTGKLIQIIQAPFPVEVTLLPVIIPASDNEGIEKEIKRLSQEQGQLLYDLGTDSLFRVCLLQLPGNKQVLLFSFHSIILDGRSLMLLLQDLQELYSTYMQGETPALEALPVQWADYACWEQTWIQSDEFVQRLNYWKEKLNNLPPLLNLSFEKQKFIKTNYNGAWEYFKLPKSLTEKLQTLSKQTNVSLYTVLLAAYKTLLMRYTGQSDIAVGTVNDNRAHSEIKNLIGPFADDVILRSKLHANKTFKKLLKELHALCKKSYEDKAIPFKILEETLYPERKITDPPLCQVGFLFKNIPFDKFELGGQQVNQAKLRSMHNSKFDIALSLEEVAGSLEGYFEYNKVLFDVSTINRFLQHYRILLDSIAEIPNQEIAAVSFITEDEREQILEKWNYTENAYPQTQCIHQLFERQVAKTPYAIAIVYEEQQLTYKELNQRSNQLAHYLIEQGVGPDIRVGLCVERSPEMVVGILGILKAGGAYVPIDPDYPAHRIDYIQHDSNLSLLLTQSKLCKIMIEAQTVTYLYLDLDWPIISEASNASPKVNVSSENLAYVIYTSGSTGQPKGVAVPHQAVNRLVFNSKYLDFNAERNILQAAPISFDAATFEIWGALLHGGKSILYNERIPMAEKLEKIIVNLKIDTLWLTTALFNLIVDERPKALSHVDNLLTGGEAASIEHIKQAYENCHDTKIINMYGPTENTTFTSYYVVSDRPKNFSKIPIGKPIGNTTIYILDPGLNSVPIGVAGELYTGGKGLARGYLEKPALTAEKFIPNPFSEQPSRRLYKTGDLVRHWPDGNIEFLARIDYQVKIRGFRIELGEIENVIAEQPGVSKAIVLALTRGETIHDKYLVAYIVLEEDIKQDSNQLRQNLIAILPDYMVPSFYIFLGELPLTPNSKIDRKALPLPDASTLQTKRYVAPCTGVENKLVSIWAEILNISVEKISTQDNFFELGGNSLLATRVVSHVRGAINTEIQVSNLFTSNTIEALAIIIDEQISYRQITKNLTSRNIISEEADMERIRI